LHSQLIEYWGKWGHGVAGLFHELIRLGGSGHGFFSKKTLGLFGGGRGV